jgi:hypothetical protein
MNPAHKFDQSVVAFEGNNERSFEIEQPSMEEVMLRTERRDGLGRRILIRALGLVAYIPELTYDLADVDRRVVDRMIRHSDLLKAIDQWILLPDQELVPILREAARIFTPMQRKHNFKKIYRGFDPRSVDQDTMGLQRRGWFGPKPAEFRVGDKFSYVTERALSFTHHEGTASVFGGVVVSIDPQRHAGHLLNIDFDLSHAISLADDSDYEKRQIPYYTTYGEFILLPNKRPVDFRVESKNG